MAYARRTDTNQKEVVSALRKVGASVQILSSVGAGVPDLLVGFKGRNFLIEVKDGSLPPSGRVLTADQSEFHRNWRGQVSVVKCPSDALALIGFQL